MTKACGLAGRRCVRKAAGIDRQALHLPKSRSSLREIRVGHEKIGAPAWAQEPPKECSVADSALANRILGSSILASLSEAGRYEPLRK